MNELSEGYLEECKELAKKLGLSVEEKYVLGDYAYDVRERGGKLIFAWLTRPQLRNMLYAYECGMTAAKVRMINSASDLLRDFLRESFDNV